MRKIFDFHGGIHPPENKTQSTQQAIETIPLADEFVVPLNQHIGAPASPIVSPGEKVLKGQCIAEAQGFISTNIHAPTSGVVEAIRLAASNHPSGLPVLSVIIKSDGEDKWINLENVSDPHSLDARTIIDLVRTAGIAGMGGAGFPTSVKLGSEKIDTFILNAAECEPYITADDMLLRNYSDEVIAGALLLSKTFPNLRNILIGIEDNKPAAIQCLQTAINNAKADIPIELLVVPTKYPSGGEKQLIYLLTGKEVPSGGIPAQIGIVMQNVGTCRAVWQALRYGKPLISRITTVVGKTLSRQGNLELPIGTPIKHVLRERGFVAQKKQRIVVGGPMMGWAIEDAAAPVLKATNCLLVPSQEELPLPPPEQACIRCGLCAEACPAELLPQQLYWYSRAEDQDKLNAYNLSDCIECGACSYVCPSAIPLVQYFRAGKGLIRQHQKEKEKSDQARLRFEARKARIEKAEAEKEAKRAARKQAAEVAKQKLAKKTGTETSGEASMKVIKSVLVENALASLKQESAGDPEKELARLQRGLSSAESRLERARATLIKNQEEGADPARLDALAARVKEAELKMHEAKKKLEERQS